MNVNEMPANISNKHSKNPLKWPSVGLFVSFKTIIIYIFLIKTIYN